METKPVVERLSWWKYEVRMTKRTWNETWDSKSRDIFIAAFVGLSSMAGEAWITKSTDWWSLAAGAIGFAIVFVAEFSWHGVVSASRNHNELVGVIEESAKRTTFADRLRARREAMSKIEPVVPNAPGHWRVAKRLLESEQAMAVGLIESTACLWTTKPVGWQESKEEPLLRWSALVSIMRDRYPHEIVPDRALYDKHIVGTVHEISSLNFPTERQCSLQCLDLIIREIEEPDSKVVADRIREPDNAVELAIARHPPPSDDASSSPSASPPSSPV